ncbi:cilia- and flagella-associated protein 251-like [Papaver somniferum]|uniref:cilia- and flagella-associated protein 251-like n=1 Tax=Papaver somniferum TaxID=3469 RepID=UPI000E6F47CD|nr:cilia- and flagella-associated protein 251-like [Papaver somniferum]
MEISSNSNPANAAILDQYQLAKTPALSLPTEDLMRLSDEIQSEINRHRSEEAQRQREEEEKRRREEEETESIYQTWLPHHLARVDRKEEEQSERYQRGPIYGSATEEDSEEGSDDEFEFHLEEVDDDYVAAEEERKMEKYQDWKQRRCFEFERANPKIFSRTMHEGDPKVEKRESVIIYPRVAYPSDSDEDLPEAPSDEEDDEDSSSGDSETSPASSGSSCSEMHEEDEADWSYDEED